MTTDIMHLGVVLSSLLSEFGPYVCLCRDMKRCIAPYITNSVNMLILFLTKTIQYSSACAMIGLSMSLSPRPCLIVCMVFNAVFNIISVVKRRQVHYSMSSRINFTSDPHNLLS